MKKTFTINISGIIFNIDEDAYIRLQKYLDSVKQHFQKMEGNEEIINDIESRIAELLEQKTDDKKQVITINDINEVIEIMGQPNQFEEDMEEETAETVYEQKSYKRLYRDGENKWVGGIASGMASYFNIDPVWIRLLFFISLFVGGTGFLVYIILWIALPEAKTTAERLEMKGEKVNISNIEKSIREEIDQLSNKLNDLKNQAKNGYKKKSESSKTVFESIVGVFVDILKIFLRVLLILIGIAFVIAGISVLIALFSSVFGWGGFLYINDYDAIPFSLPVFFNVFLGPDFNLTLLNLSLMLFLGIPFLMLIYNGIRLLFGIDSIKYLGITALNLWIIGVIMISYFSIKAYNHYKYEANNNEEIALKASFANNIYLQLNNEFYEDVTKISDYFIMGDAGVLFMENGEFKCIPHLRVRKSKDSTFSLKYYHYARGNTRQIAMERAEDITYQFETTDTSIVFNPFFNFEDDKSWHGEQLDIVLYVPENTKVNYDKNMWKITERYDHNSFSDYRRSHFRSKPWSKTISRIFKPQQEIVLTLWEKTISP